MNLQQSTRRHFFSRCSIGLGSIALSTLINKDTAKAQEANPFLPSTSHFLPKAKNVIYSFIFIVQPLRFRIVWNLDV